ncbi:MAG: AAA family ATPase [Lacunisphaera sp.]|nr:AAA family ATPase [Lacunisphaera sp.]
MPEPTTLPAPSLLIAVTGGPGSSKTRLLAELAAAQISAGQRVEGVLAVAGQRQAPDVGANEYWLRLIGTEQELSWAVRDESLVPPYYFEPETEKKLRLWADRLRAAPPTPLLVLDEFSKFEAKRKGLMPLWPTLVAAGPHIVVIAVRQGLVASIEEVIGRRFDLCISATDPDALAQLERACEDFGEWTRLGLFGGAAGGLEMTVGSALHAAKIPLRGLAMSSLQAGMMVFAGSGLSQPGRVVWVPFISGGLKALSPAGNRVRPMIAIVMQGLLFGTSVQAFGWNFFALGLGGALIGVWAALQGFFLQYLMLGGEMMRAYDTVMLWLADKWHITAPGLPWLVGGWAALHALVAASVTVTAWRLKSPPAALHNIIARENIPSAASTGPTRTGWRRLREFGHWQFWLPLLVVATILAVGGSTWETLAWMVLRFVAAGCVLMAVVSLLRPARWAEQLRKRGWWGPAVAFSGAMRRNRSGK